ncbi:MAG: outer membrane beta-barrel domain-containing protein [Bacteriovoracaceae bacterium]|nr:outer membrane beta-barrel domain-containing protein [Bacteriovoracaceae bacterium]
MKQKKNEMIWFYFSMLIALIFIENTYADQENLYEFEWLDKDKKIYVLQNRLYNKTGRVHLSLLGQKDTANAFVDSYYGAIKGGYFFTETWGLELGYASGVGSTNATAKSIIEQSTVPFYRKIKSVAHANVIWSPFYGKFNTFDKIFYIDWFVGLGLASITDENNKNQFVVTTNETLVSENHTGLLWNTGFFFYLSNSWSVRFEFQGIHYQSLRYREPSNQSEFSTKTYSNNYSLNLGMTWHL